MTTTTHSQKAVVTLPAERQILIVREFAAPKHLVYKAATTPELVRRWWAGQRGTVTSAEIDLRVGGRWRYVMIAHGGLEVAFHGEFLEIVPNERTVNTEVYEGIPNGDDFPAVNTATYTEHAGRTTLSILCEYPSREIRDMVIASGMEGGMQEGMDLLEELAIGLADR